MSHGATVTEMIDADSSFITDMNLSGMKNLSDEIKKDELNKKMLSKAKKQMETLRPWQKELVEITKTNENDREVIVIVEKKGGKEKIFITQALQAIDNNNHVIINMAQACDVYCMLAKKSSPKTVHIDLPRSTLDKDIDWTVIESIKNGQFQSNKYSSQRIGWLKKSHVTDTWTTRA